jgi:error-prone DNA polymerase
MVPRRHLRLTAFHFDVHVYIELHASSAFSFLDGASLPEALVDRAATLGYPALALLDRDGLYGAPRFHLAARRAGIKAIVGAELTIGAAASASVFRLPVLVESVAGYRNLCRLVTRMKLRAPKGEGALSVDELDGHVGGLMALVGRAALSGRRFGVGGLVDRIVGTFGVANVCVEVQRHLLRDEEADNQALVELAAAFHVPVIATNGVRFAQPSDRPLYDVLTCIRHKTTLERAGRRLAWNAERYLKPPDAMARLFADMPHAVAASGEIADRLTYSLADLGYRFPEYPVPSGETMASFLRKITQVGARERYRPFNERARRQVERELDLIEKLDLAGYFLIVWDIVNYCRQHEILVQGRGSAANSAVCYSLGITAVDPVGMDLLFERFLSEERGEWPDIDLDLPSGDRRERVIQHLYEKYGDRGAAPAGEGIGAVGPAVPPGISLVGPRIAMTANVITYRGRSAAREVGKVLSLETAQVDRLAKVMNHFEWVDPKETLARNLKEVGLDAQHPAIQTFGRLWQSIQDLPRHLGQHSGGMVMSQGRLDDVVPLENASMPNRVVVQWDKDDCADIGIVKVDLLGLGMMAVLQDALELVNGGMERGGSGSGLGIGDSGLGSGGSGFGTGDSGFGTGDSGFGSGGSGFGSGKRASVDLAHLPADDPAVYRMLQEADTIGIFQVESRAQMATLPRLKPARFYDIVVEVAIIRPGPIVGQMVHPFLTRRQGLEPVTYPHPSLEPILARTLGVPLFQEQLLRMAMVAAGFSGGEAEELRRAFGFKRSEHRMQHIEGKLRAGMAKQQITGAAADEIIRSITSFALYGFPESHAASFALLVYASAYLKAHYPAAFYTALLNNQPMGFYHPATLVKDAQRHGVRFAPIDVQESDWTCRVEPDGRVRLGLMYVNGLRQDAGRLIAAAGPPSHTFEHAGPSDRCPKCGCDDESMLEATLPDGYFCNICAHEWGKTNSAPALPVAADVRPGTPGSMHTASETAGVDSGSKPEPASTSDPRYTSIDDLIARTRLRRDELATLADIGALNAFGFNRRSALWQVERAVRPAGELFSNSELSTPNSQLPTPNSELPNPKSQVPNPNSQLPNPQSQVPNPVYGPPVPSPESRIPSPGPEPRVPNPESQSPLPPMTAPERLMADYAGTSLTIGPHPLALRRAELALRGVLRARDLPHGRHGRRVRIAGAVITRQRPGTAKGFVFLTLEDETGIANVIVRPDLFTEQRHAIVGEPYLLVEGTLQIQEGVTSVKAERVIGLSGGGPQPESHDFR